MASAPTTASRSPEPTTRAPGGASHDARPAVDVTALTTRDDFLLELGQALGRQAAVRPVESLEETLLWLAPPLINKGVPLRGRESGWAFDAARFERRRGLVTASGS